LREKLRELAHQRRRFVYRRLHILLRREGLRINHKKTQRLYREEGLTVRRRKGRKRAVAREKIAAWAHDYNTGRPHSSLGYATPDAFAADLK
jgi:transposase InsO family protein